MLERLEKVGKKETAKKTKVKYNITTFSVAPLHVSLEYCLTLFSEGEGSKPVITSLCAFTSCSKAVPAVKRSS